MSEYSIAIEPTDTSVAFDCEADRAQREGFSNVEKRQRATALHIRNAVHHMQTICPEGYSVRTRIVVEHVPSINPVLKDECRK